MLGRLTRNYATRRIVPYITKGKWQLPDPLNCVKNSAREPQLPPTLSQSPNWGVSPSTGINVPKEWRQIRHLPQWKRQMFALKEKFPEGWNPLRKLPREQMEQLRQMKASQPNLNNNQLGEMFRVSPEAVRRILKSSWKPSVEDTKEIKQRWIRRGQRLGATNASRSGTYDCNYGGSSRRNGLKSKPSVDQASRRIRDPGQNIF